jgi:hypothetical protein
MCDCETCQYGRKFEAWRNTLPVEARQFADELYESMCITEDELAYCRAILDGHWPGSLNILRKAVTKARLNDIEAQQECFFQ